eukprot:3848156-Rhodomonas_salina.1
MAGERGACYPSTQSHHSGPSLQAGARLPRYASTRRLVLKSVCSYVCSYEGDVVYAAARSSVLTVGRAVCEYAATRSVVLTLGKVLKMDDCAIGGDAFSYQVALCPTLSCHAPTAPTPGSYADRLAFCTRASPAVPRDPAKFPTGQS